ncbi:MAG: hypothetical protein JNK85_10445 [Verrucomicrobiales bacterium]|nr:hypothetical protein [Verrucomicrobiales bacterium]
MNPRATTLASALRRLLLPALLAGILRDPGASAQPTNSPAAAPTTPASRSDFATYRVIAERNIFNAGRSGRTGPAASRETRRPPRVDTVALVGTMSYEKGTFAFFEGSSSEFRKVLKTGGTIAGYTLREITPAGVQLQSGEKTLQLKVNSQLRREDDGEWEITARTESSASPTSSSSGSRRDRDASADNGRDRRESRSSEGGGTAAATSGSAPASDPSEVLKRLMQQREQELK